MQGKKPKPNPEIILKALKKLKTKPKNAIVVGDMPLDIKAAKNAKCFSVGFMVRGDKMINRLEKLMEILNKNIY